MLNRDKFIKLIFLFTLFFSSVNCSLNASITSLESTSGKSLEEPQPTVPDSTPTSPLPPVALALELRADEMSTCLIKNHGLICWGENAHYEKLTGGVTNVLSPVSITALNSNINDIENGFNFSCVLINSGVKCWGVNDLGQLGDGTTITRTSPVDVLGLESNVKKIVLGFRHACALLNDGGVKCWGDNNAGELGRGFTDTPGGYRSTADYVSGLTAGVSDIAAGSIKSETTCALINGGVKCWGYNAWGELGDGTTTDRNVPTLVSGIGTANDVLKVAPGRYFSCALQTSNRLKCWGQNDYGQLANNNVGVNSPTPVAADLSNLGASETVIDIGVGEDQGCLLTDLGGVYCWGGNDYGQLGIGITQSSPAGIKGKPTVSLIASGAKKLSVGRYHACVILNTNDEIKCWGANTFGQLGVGTTSNSNSPLTVSLPTN